MAGTPSSSFFQEYSLTESQSATVEAALEEMNDILNQVRLIRDSINGLGEIGPDDIAALLQAKVDAEAAADIATAAADTVGTAATDAVNAAALAEGHRTSAEAAANVATAKADLITDAVASATASAASAAQSEANAALRAGEADRAANEEEDVQILPGRYSANHYLRKAEEATQQGSAFIRRTYSTGDARMTGNNFVIGIDDLFKLNELKCTANTTVTLMPNLWTTLAADGSPTEAWIRLRLHKDSTNKFTLTPYGTPVPQAVQKLKSQVFTYAASPAVSGYSGSHSITVPAGTNRKIGFLMHATFATAKTGRNSTLTCSASDNLLKLKGDTATGNFSAAAGVDACVWVCDLDDSTTPTDHTIVLSPDADPVAYVLAAFAVGNCASTELDTAVSNTSAATTKSITTDPTDTLSYVIGMMSFLGSDALPITNTFPSAAISEGVGKTPLSRTGQDIAYSFFSESRLTDNAAHTYTATSAKAIKGASCGLVFRPSSVITSSVTLTAPDGADVTAAGTSIVVTIASDGLTYVRE